MWEYITIMISAFTICSNNYLPQAITLAKSVQTHAPNWKFFIGLVDTPLDIDGVTIPIDLTIIELANLNLPDIPAMSARYNIIELCTSVKPAFFKYIFDNYPSIEQLHYLDPDTKLLSNPNPLEAALLQADVIITPHHYHPIPLDGQFPQENLALNHGIYNLGYLGLKRSEVADKLLEWWHARMIEYCRIDLVNITASWHKFCFLEFP
jgi:hypothetical protein